MKKGRHRRYEEARALKRGGDLDIEGIFSDLSEDPVAPGPATEDDDVEDDRYSGYDEYADDEDPVRD